LREADLSLPKCDETIETLFALGIVAVDSPLKEDAQMSAVLRSVDLDEHSGPNFLKKVLDKNQTHESQKDASRASKSENVFQLLERALQTLEFLHQRCAELNEQLVYSKKRTKELEEKNREWERIAQASLEQAKHSEQLRISLQAQLDNLTKEVEKKTLAESEEYNFHDRIWNMFCAHSKSYEILKEVADGTYGTVPENLAQNG